VRPSRLMSAAVAVGVAASPLLARPAQADQIREKQWHIRSLKVAEANRITSGAGVVVAVVDTGVFPHVDVRSNLLAGTSVVSHGGNGQVDRVGHGTAIASLIAAHGRGGGSGVAGIAPDAKILPVIDTDSKGGGNALDAAAGFNWAIDHGAKIINFSAAVGPSDALDSAIKLASERDVLIIAASGNQSQDVVAAYPAALPGVLAVGASDQNGKPATFSIPGKNVQICAPGVAIESASPNNRYSTSRGTSEATAIVSGAAALVRAKFPELSAQEVIHRLTATATDNGPTGRDDKCGYGVLNIVKALTADVPPLGGTAGPGVSASASTVAPTSDVPSGAVAEPDIKPAGRNTPAIVGGVVFGLLVVGLLVFLGLRRRRSS
jgi:type VII secretion-associated serine protease mycosin